MLNVSLEKRKQKVMKTSNCLDAVHRLFAAAVQQSGIAVQPTKPAKTQGTKGSKAPKTPKAPKVQQASPAKKPRGAWVVKTLAQLTKGNFVKLSTAESKAKIFGYYNGTVVIDKKTGIKAAAIKTTKGVIKIQPEAITAVNVYVKTQR